MLTSCSKKYQHILTLLATFVSFATVCVLVCSKTLQLPARAEPATIYYVAKNNPSGCSDSWMGTEEQPWCSVQGALDGVVAGDTIFIKDGVYIISSTLKIPSGITLNGSGKDTVIKAADGMFDGKSAPDNRVIANEHMEGGDSNIVIRDLVVDGNKTGNTDNGYGIAFDNCPNSQIINVKVQNIPTAVEGPQGGEGILVAYGSRNILIDNVEVTNCHHAINPHGGAQNVTIKNSKLHNNRAYGIVVEGGSDILIENNQIYDNANIGLVLFASPLETSTQRVTISNNTIVNNLNGGIKVDASLLSVNDWTLSNNIVKGSGNYFGLWIHEGSHGVIKNNIIYNNTALCLYDNGGTDIKFFNNVCYGNDPPDIWILGDASLTTIKNNIIYTSGIGLRVEDGVQAGFVSDYNLFFRSSGGDVIEWRPALSLYTGGADGTFCANQNQECNSPNDSPPLFFDPVSGDFHLISKSPAIDSGTDVGVYTDFEGNTRPVGPRFDIGAYEYNSRPLHGDANGDGRVDSEDFALLVEDYLGQPLHNTDFNSDGRVDSEDFAILQSNYLK